MKTIDYIEFWATKHCNLNCKGCSSCSPISEEWYLNPDNLRCDFARLRELELIFSNIAIIGGEPLLHPKIIDLFDIVKNIYPDCNLSMLTNGILLSQMSSSFWEKCVEHSVEIKVTCFPIFTVDEITKIELLMKKYNVEYHLTQKTKFNKILVENNQSDMEDIVQACGCNKAYNLYNGFVSRCTVPMVTELLNERFKISLNTGGRLNIYQSTGDEVFEFLTIPNESCINCTSKPIKIDWEKETDNPQKEDWIIGD